MLHVDMYQAGNFLQWEQSIKEYCFLSIKVVICWVYHVHRWRFCRLLSAAGNVEHVVDIEYGEIDQLPLSTSLPNCNVEFVESLVLQLVVVSFLSALVVSACYCNSFSEFLLVDVSLSLSTFAVF